MNNSYLYFTTNQLVFSQTTYRTLAITLGRVTMSLFRPPAPSSQDVCKP